MADATAMYIANRTGFDGILYSFSSSLNIRKGSRTGNSGNNLEFSVLTLRTYVPWTQPHFTLKTWYFLYAIRNKLQTISRPKKWSKVKLKLSARRPSLPQKTPKWIWKKRRILLPTQKSVLSRTHRSRNNKIHGEKSLRAKVTSKASIFVNFKFGNFGSWCAIFWKNKNLWILFANEQGRSISNKQQVFAEFYDSKSQHIFSALR